MLVLVSGSASVGCRRSTNGTSRFAIGATSPTTAGSRSCACAGSRTWRFAPRRLRAPRGTTTTRAPSSTCRSILKELTALDIRTDGSLILTLDDPELFKYPIAFMWEPGFWNLTDREAESFRAYLLKGGFAVFEDFDGPQQWNNFEAQMRRVLPDGRFVKLDKSHRIFDTFFQIKDIDAIVHPMSGIRPSYYGIFEDNDPSKRLMVVANFDNDVPEYWEWSGAGALSVRHVERGLQARRQLRHLRPDALRAHYEVKNW